MKSGVVVYLCCILCTYSMRSIQYYVNYIIISYYFTVIVYTCSVCGQHALF